MIEVQNLTKRYGQLVALDSVSFSVGRGEVVGFLGPNGAGKSTTMRILTTFMAATSGTARVGGDCVFENPMRVRERLGYMPENNPLPPDLRVGDYLKFRAQLKRLANGDSAQSHRRGDGASAASPMSPAGSSANSRAATGNAWAWPTRSWPSRS